MTSLIPIKNKLFGPTKGKKNLPLKIIGVNKAKKEKVLIVFKKKSLVIESECFLDCSKISY